MACGRGEASPVAKRAGSIGMRVPGTYAIRCRVFEIEDGDGFVGADAAMSTSSVNVPGICAWTKGGVDSRGRCGLYEADGSERG